MSITTGIQTDSFSQTQIARQLHESEKYDITRVEDKGTTYDIDIELDGYVCLQAWLGSNVAGHNLDREVASSNSPWVLYSQRTCLDKDLDVRQHKLDQTDKPTLDGAALKPNYYTLYAQHPLWSQVVLYPYAMPMPSIRSATCPVKIVVAMSPTRLPLHFLPEWDPPSKGQDNHRTPWWFRRRGQPVWCSHATPLQQAVGRGCQGCCGRVGFPVHGVVQHLGGGPAIHAFWRPAGGRVAEFVPQYRLATHTTATQGYGRRHGSGFCERLLHGFRI